MRSYVTTSANLLTQFPTHDYGANIGKILLTENVSDAKTIARAYAAAGSDARMSGCEMPVAII